MFYTPQISDNLKILIDEEVKDFMVINSRDVLNIQEEHCVLK